MDQQENAEIPIDQSDFNFDPIFRSTFNQDISDDNDTFEQSSELSSTFEDISSPEARATRRKIKQTQKLAIELEAKTQERIQKALMDSNLDDLRSNREKRIIVETIPGTSRRTIENTNRVCEPQIDYNITKEDLEYIPPYKFVRELTVEQELEILDKGDFNVQMFMKPRPMFDKIGLPLHDMEDDTVKSEQKSKFAEMLKDAKNLKVSVDVASDKRTVTYHGNKDLKEFESDTN